MYFFSFSISKRKKLHGFSYTKNIANFEAFCLNISLSANLLFLKSEGILAHDFLPKKTFISHVKFRNDPKQLGGSFFLASHEP